MPDKVAEETSLIVNDDSNNGIASTSPPGFPKKTRDLPNLSECHNCGYRINTTNGRDKLQTLRSEWRILLLCRKCVKLVDSGELCPYCFSEASKKEERFRCRDCSRRVHEDCVLKLKGFAPSSYFCRFAGSGFTVCPDCWLPEPLLKLRSRAGFKGGCRSRKVSKSGNGDLVASKECVKALEDAVKDAISTMEKKVLAAAKAREMAATKAVVASKAVEIANTALDLVSKREETGTNSAVANRAVDDAELAFQLHRALNSSLRISKNLCSMNSNCLAVPATMSCNGKSSIRAVSEFSGQQENVKCNGGNCNVKATNCLDKPINPSGVDNSLDTKSQSSGGGKEMHSNHIRSHCQCDCDNKTDRYYLKYSTRKSSLEAAPRFHQSCGNEMQLDPNNIQSHCQTDCDTKSDRYYLKYIRRKSSSKATPSFAESCGNKMHLDPNNVQSHCQTDCDTKNVRYYLKYSRRKSSSKATPKFTEFCWNEKHLDPKNIQSRCQTDCDTKNDRYHFKYSKRKLSSEATPRFTQYCGSEMHLHPNNIQSPCQTDCDKKNDRYYLKYSKRKSSMEGTPRFTQSCGNEMHLDPNNIQSHCQTDCCTKTDHYYLKYSKRKSSSEATPRFTQSFGNVMHLHPNNFQSHCQMDCDKKTDR